MDRLDIKIAMLKKDISAVKIAKVCDVTPGAVYKVMSGKTTSKRIAAEIEKVLEMPIKEVQDAYRKRYVPSQVY